MRYSIEPSKFDAIFGPRDPMDSKGPGRVRRCKITGQWFKPGQNPHNLPTVAPKRNNNLATPQLAPTFEGFRAVDELRDRDGNLIQEAVDLTSRNDVRDHMARHDLVPYDEGVNNGDTWVTERQEKQQVVDDIKMFSETDTEADVWSEFHENNADAAADLEQTDEINTDSIEVVE